MPDITVNLPDGSAKSLAEGTTVLGLAESIGPRLAQAAIAGKVGGTLVDVSTTDGSISTYLNFDRAQVIKLLQVAEAHHNLDALRVLRIRDQWMAKEELLKFFADAFGSGRRDAWLTQNFHRLARSPLSSVDK